MKRAKTAARFFLALILGLTAAFGIATTVSGNTPPSLMSRADYLSGLQAAVDRTRLALGACRELGDSERAVCRAQARADERVTSARLEAQYRGTIAARDNVRRVQARAAHSVAEARRLAPA